MNVQHLDAHLRSEWGPPKYVPFFIILIILQMRAIEVENRQIYQSVITVKSFLTTLKDRQTEKRERTFRYLEL